MANIGSGRSLAFCALVFALSAEACARATASPSFGPARMGSAPASVHVKVLGINDFHGQLSPKTMKGRPVGGASVLASYLHAAAAGFEDRTFVVHAGDLVGASPANSALLQDEPAVMLMNGLANSACTFERARASACNVIGTVGNHEFDEGITELRRLLEGGCHANGPYLDNPWRGARFPTVAANVLDAATGQPVFAPYVVRDVAGVKLAFVGAVLRATPSIVMASGVAGLTFSDEADAVNRVIPELHAQGVHAIVVMIHQGLTQPPYEGPTRCDTPQPTGPLLDVIRGLDDDVDVIVSGHTHQFTNALVANAHGKEILVVQAFSAGTAFDDIDLWVDPASQDIVSKRAQIVTTWGDVGPGRSPDAPAAALVARADAMVADRVKEAVTQLSEPLEHGANDAGESVLGDVIADAQRAATGADFAIINPGGVRADLPSGVVTWGAIFAVQPFGNDVVKVSLTGRDLVDLLSGQWGPGQPSGGRILSISGFGYSYSRAPSEAGSRVREVHDSQGNPVVATQSYTLAANRFLAEGGDGFSVLKRLTRVAAGRLELGRPRRLFEEGAEAVRRATGDANRPTRSALNSRSADQVVRPVLCATPSASTTSADCTAATAMARGAAMGAPCASRHVPGATQRVPFWACTNAHGENRASFGASTHRPTSQAHRPRRQTHSPSIHTDGPCGRSGTISTRAGGGGAVTSTRALVG